MCLTHVGTCPLLTLLPDELHGSVRGQNGVEFRQEFSKHGLRHGTLVLLTLLLVELKGSEGTKWGRILPKIQSTWSQRRDTCLTWVSNVSTHVHF